MNAGIKKKKYFTSVIIVAGINLAIFGAWQLFLSEVAKEKTAVFDLRREISVSDKRLNNARLIDSFLERSKSEIEKVSAAFLDSKGILKFVEKLELLSQKTGVSLKLQSADFSAQSDASGQAGGNYPKFSFRAEGSFRDVFQYLYLFENLPYKTSIERLAIFKPEEEAFWRADFDVLLLSYEKP